MYSSTPNLVSQHAMTQCIPTQYMEIALLGMLK